MLRYARARPALVRPAADAFCAARALSLVTARAPRRTLPNYRHHTGSWYASNFRAVAHASNEKVTLDASPTMFNAVLLAPPFIRKWVPDAKLVVLLREPVQRTYSHWRTGVSWLKASPCFRIEPAMSNASAAKAIAYEARAAAAAGQTPTVITPGLPAPVPEIRMMREVFNFDAVARLGVMEVSLRECGAASGWGKEGGAITLTNRSKACILESHMAETVAGLWHARQALAAKRSAPEAAAYVEGMRRVSVCSEFMLRSGAGVWRSSRYAENLKQWYRHLPREHIKVMATEAMERDPAAALADVLAFVGLPPPASALAKAGGAKGAPRYCLNGRHGVIVDSASQKWHASRLDGAAEGGAGGGISACEAPDDQVRGPDGVLRYKIAPATEALLQRFFAPYNQKLFDVLGRKLEWAVPP